MDPSLVTRFLCRKQKIQINKENDVYVLGCRFLSDIRGGKLSGD